MYHIDPNCGTRFSYFLSKRQKQDKEPAGLIILESCSVQATSGEKHGFEISFDGPGTRTYLLVADNDEEMQSWMRAVSHASYEYLKSIVLELQRQVDTITSRSQTSQGEAKAAGREKGRGEEGERIPTLPKPKMKIENGVVVDVEEAPPIPYKQRRRRLEPATGKDSSSLDAPVNAPAFPHASPMVPYSSVKPQKPLSPPGTLDRTPTLSPTVAPSPTSKPLIDLTDVDYDTPPPPVPEKSEQTRRLLAQQTPSETFVDHPSSYSPTIVKKLASSSDSSKTVYEMHQNFTEAMQALKDERTQQTGASHL